MRWQEHLLNFIDEYEEHGVFVEARGAMNSVRYMSLRKVKDYEDYDDPVRSQIMKLRDAWTEWTETTTMTWKKHLQNFIDEYEEHGDFVEARGAHHTPRYHTLWKVRDYTPEDYDEPVRSQIIKLRDVWETPETTSWREHLQNFIDEYEAHGVFVEARGANGTARYDALRKVKNYTAEDYDEPMRSQIIKLRDVWETPETTSWQEHLQNFIDEYEAHGVFEKARGANQSARYQTLLRVRDLYEPEDYDEPVQSQIIKLRDAWIGTYVPDVPDVSDEEDFEKYFVAQANESLHL